jgi:hypothetical protein
MSGLVTQKQKRYINKIIKEKITYSGNNGGV